MSKKTIQDETDYNDNDHFEGLPDFREPGRPIEICSKCGTRIDIRDRLRSITTLLFGEKSKVDDS